MSMSFFVPLGVGLVGVDLPVLAIYPSTGVIVFLYIGLAVIVLGAILTFRSSRSGS